MPPGPVRYEEGNGLHRDADGHYRVLFGNAAKQKLKKDGSIEIPSGATYAGEVAARTRRQHLPLGAWTPDATNPPTAAAVGLARGLAFDADNERLAIALRVPSDWDGESDMALVLAWANQTGTAIAEGETVEWNLAWRSKADAEVLDAGTAGAAVSTYTESEDPGDDKAVHVTALVIDHDHASQPLAAGDLLMLELARDFTTDTYAADAVVVGAWLEYQSSALAVE